MICKSYDGKRLKCNIENCGKFFHENCLKNGLWPQAKLGPNHPTCPGELNQNAKIPKILLFLIPDFLRRFLHVVRHEQYAIDVTTLPIL